MYNKPLTKRRGTSKHLDAGQDYQQDKLMVDGMPMTTKVDISPNVKIPDGPRSLWDLANQLESGNLEVPLHQRSDDAWDFKKKKAWIVRCYEVLSVDKPSPLGSGCIYQLRNSGAKQYLNEGLQRISAALKAKLAPEEYGYSIEEIEKVLSLTYLHIQNRIYNDHKEAAADYRAVNNGTVLQPIEQNKSEYLYHDKWPAWKQPFNEWHNAIEKCLVEYSQAADRRGARLSRERQELQLFTVGCMKRPTSYGRDNKLEKLVSQCLSQEQPHKMMDLIRKLKDCSAEIFTAWRESDPGSHYAKKMDGTFARWCVGVMFLHDDLKPNWWQPFFAKLFKHTGGSAVFNYTSEQGKAKNNNLTTRLHSFRTVCKVLSIDIPEQAQRPRSRSRLSPGFQEDHIKSFADHGDGETQPLAGRLNASKNARRVELVPAKATE